MSSSLIESKLRQMVGDVISREMSKLYFQADNFSGAVSDAVNGGIPAKAAVKAAARIIIRRRGKKCSDCAGGLGECCNDAVDGYSFRSNLGDSVSDALKEGAEIEVVKSAREAITPWLWIFSVAGFGMAVLNSRRIAKIYGGWRRGGTAIKKGILPPVRRTA